MERLEIHLRPFEEIDLDMLDRVVSKPSFGGVFEWTGFGSSAAIRRRWSDERLLGASPYYLVVATTDDSAVGWVNWRVTDRAGPDVWEIGIVIVPEARGRGAGAKAQSLLADHLFATTPTNRIWAGTEQGNVAEQGALEACGFQREGLLRGHLFRDGQWRDSYIYGLTRNDNAQRSRP